MPNVSYLEPYEVFPYPPLLEMEETLSTETDVLPAKDGSEQRISMRGTPRQGYGISTFLNSEAEIAKLEASLFTWMKLFWGLPIWGESTVHTDTISAGASSIVVDTSYADYREDTLAIIWKSTTEFETVLISTVNPNSLGLASNVVSAFTGAKLIMPCRQAQIVDSVGGVLESDEESHYDFQFLVTDNIRLTGHIIHTIYKGREVITTPGKILAGEQNVANSNSYVEDYRTGLFKHGSDSTYNILSRSYFNRYESREAVWNYRLFLHSLYGKQVPVWLPTFKKDLQFNTTIGASDTVIQIDNIGLTDNMGLNSLRTNLAFLFPNGTQLNREILGVADDSGSSEQVTIDAALGVEVPVGGCTISFLDLCRRSSDETRLIWRSNDRCDSLIDYTVITQ